MTNPINDTSKLFRENINKNIDNQNINDDLNQKSLSTSINKSTLIDTKNFNINTFLGRNIGLSFTDDEVCWQAWNKICTCLNIDPEDRS